MSSANCWPGATINTRPHKEPSNAPIPNKVQGHKDAVQHVVYWNSIRTQIASDPSCPGSENRPQGDIVAAGSALLGLRWNSTPSPEGNCISGFARRRAGFLWEPRRNVPEEMELDPLAPLRLSTEAENVLRNWVMFACTGCIRTTMQQSRRK